MPKRLKIAAAALAAALLAAAPAARATNVRDVVELKGMQDHQIFGVGLVVGLRGTGDKGRETQKRIARVLSRVNLTVRVEDLPSKNVALVFVTARVRPFAQAGTRLDVTVSSMGDAGSILGGELLPTPLHADNPEVIYARAQGKLPAGSPEAAAFPTVATITGGATIEKEIPCDALEKSFTDAAGRRFECVELTLSGGDFSLAGSVAGAINTGLRAPADAPLAQPLGPDLVRVTIPENRRDQKLGFINELLDFPVLSEPPATVVINEQTKVIVATRAVRISPVAIKVGGRDIKISKDESLENLQSVLNELKVSSDEAIAIIKELDHSKALRARLICH